MYPFFTMYKILSWVLADIIADLIMTSDRELRFGYQLNGSLVIATKEDELKILDELMERGRKNGVKRLRIVQKDELFKMEPALNPDAIAALHSPDAGNVIPYEFAIALAENAVDNGVELRIRREVTDITKKGDLFKVDVRHWEPKAYVDARERLGKSADGSEPTASGGGSLIFKSGIAVSSIGVMIKGIMMAIDENVNSDIRLQSAVATLFVGIVTALLVLKPFSGSKKRGPTVLKDLIDKCSSPVGSGSEGKVEVEDMKTGGSGSWNAVKGVTVGRESVKTRYVINCAGSSSDKIARMIGDDGFYIKPRLGDYLLLNRNQGHLTRHTIFPCPDPVSPPYLQLNKFCLDLSLPLYGLQDASPSSERFLFCPLCRFLVKGSLCKLLFGVILF